MRAHRNERLGDQKLVIWATLVAAGLLISAPAWSQVDDANDSRPHGTNESKSADPGDVSSGRGPADDLTNPSARTLDSADEAAKKGEEDSNPEPEEIVVSAQRRSATLQETNISMTALSAEDLIDRNVTDIVDFSEFVPNFTATPNSSGVGLVLTVRGISLIDSMLVSRDSPVAFYIDGVYQSFVVSDMLSLLDVQRVEVLRGPQGDLYGRNASAGAINFITRKPVGEVRTRVRTVVGNRYTASGTAQQEFPIFGGPGTSLPESAGTLSGLISAGVNYSGPTYPNTVGPAIDNNRSVSGRVALGYDSSSLRNDLTVDFSLADQQYLEPQLTIFENGQPATPLLDGTVEDLTNGAFGVDIRPFVSQSRRTNLDILGADATGPGLPNDRTESVGVSNSLAVDVGSWGVLGSPQLKSITGYRQTWLDIANDFDGTPFDLYSSVRSDDIWQISQELALQGTSQGEHGRVDWQLGYFYIHEDGKTDSTTYTYQDPRTHFPSASNGRVLEQTPEIRNDANAIYGHLAWVPPVLDNRMKLEFGARGTWEIRRITSSSVTIPSDGTPPIVGVPAGTSAEKSFSAFTPTGRVGYFVTEELNLYGSVSKGFLSGGFNGRANSVGTGFPSDLDSFYEPESVTTYEIGFKLRAWENRLSLNAAGFYSDYRNIQRTTIVDVSPVQDGSLIVPAVINAEKARIWGAETEFAVNPIDEITINANYGLTKAEYIKYTDFIPGGGGATEDFADSRVFSNVPEHQFSAGLQFERELASWSTLFARIDYSWQSATVLQGGVNPAAGQSAYGLLNASLSLREIGLGSRGGILAVTLWGRNLMSEEVKLFGVDFSPNSVGNLPWTVQFFNAPRSYGMSLLWEFP